ncbi:MAG: hypothetical protein K6E49_02560 [Lachnospiraceae bacterium]|nr:hypothetical protein [Lachnospiraceae bacterium]
MNKIKVLTALLVSVMLTGCVSVNVNIHTDSPEPVQEETGEHVQMTDIEGCDTFTQIVDRKLTKGMAYTNAPICKDGALLVAEGAYDNLDGNMAAIDAEVYIYSDGKIVYAGYAQSDGTAYPLSVKDDRLYTAGNHFVTRYAVKDEKLVVEETAGETFDTEQNVTYYYESDDKDDSNDVDQSEAEKKFDELWEEYLSADILNFDVIR